MTISDSTNTHNESAPSERASWRDLWPTRLYYLLWFAGLGFVSPFLNLYLVKLGLNGTEIGWIIALASIVTLIAAPFWANRNDRWRNPRRILQLLLVFSGLCYVWLAQQGLFWGIALVSAIQAVVMAGVPAISDALALRVTSKTKAGYGSIRVYGSLGWMIFVLLAGWVVQQTELKNSLYGAAFFVLLSAVSIFPIQGQHFASTRPDSTTTSVRQVIDKIFKNRALIGAGLMVIITVVAGSGIFQFQGVYLGELGAPATVIGIGGMAASVVELPFMVWSDQLTMRWGAHRLLMLAMLLYALLRGIVFLFPSIPLILIMEAATGIGYSFLTVALVRVIAEQTDDHETRTVLALYTVTLTSLISIVAGPLIGKTFDLFGARSLYLIAAVGYALAWLSLYLTRPVSGSQPSSTDHNP